MKKSFVVRIALLAVALLTSVSVHSMSLAECGSLRTDQSFAVSFDVQNANGSEFVGLFYNIVSPVNLWSTQPFPLYPTAFNDNLYIQSNNTYRVWITYNSQSSNSGQLTLYRYVNGKWTFANINSINFGFLITLNLGYYGNGVTNFACDTTNVFPPIPSVEFERPLICDLFPEPAQSWISNNTQNYSFYGNSSLILNNSNVRINGFSERFVKNNRILASDLQSDSLKTGFDVVNTSAFGVDGSRTNICQGIGCSPEDQTQQRKIAPPPLTNNSFSSSQNVDLVDGIATFNLLGLIVLDDPRSYRQVCNKTYSSASICTYTESATTNRVDITIHKNLRTLNIDAFYNKLLVVHFADNIQIQHLIYKGNVAAYFDQNKMASFSTITTGLGALMAFESGAWINISDDPLHNIELQMDYPVRFFYIGEAATGYQYPVFYGPMANFKIQSNQTEANGIYKGYLLARQVELTSNTRVDGAVTAHQLTMSGSANIQALNGINQCSIPVSHAYTLTMTPTESYALSCQKQIIQLQVSREDGTPATDFTGNIYVSPASGLSVVAGSGGSGSNGLFKPDSNGLLQLELAPGQTQDVNVMAYLSTQDIGQAVSGLYHFVPYAFSADNQRVIANKPQAMNIKVLACDDGGNAVDIGYQGTPEYTSQWVAPTPGQGSLTMSNLAFTAGQATPELLMTDAGIQRVTLSDNKFNCQQFGSDCPIKGNGKLQGSFEVYSRPWTLAVCPVTGSNSMDGNISDPASPKFAVAGEDFSVRVKPLKWPAGGNISESIFSDDARCALPITENFFANDARLATQVALLHSVAEPSDGQSGLLRQTINTEQGMGISTTDITLANTAGTSASGLVFSQLAWSEVGVLRLTAQIKNDAGYLVPEHKVQHGYRHIGRFSPDHFTLVSNTWNYANNHTGFAYMDQPINYGFFVEARNKQQQVTQNYAAFPAALKSDIRVYAQHDGVSLMERVTTNPTLWDGELGQWTNGSLNVSDTSFTFAKQADPLPPETGAFATIPDGPYRDEFGLAVATIVDGVTFDLGAQVAFSQQPDFRYGRLQLADVGGNSDDAITVPVEAQYWDGQQFITNTDDSGSQFAIDNGAESLVCIDTALTSASLDLAPPLQTVNNGIGEGLVAQQSELDRENRGQVRFWMRIADNSVQLNENDVVCGDGALAQPWLQFNWRGKGDEDPSTLITFGVYRGNDRIIYRGEPRINN